MTMISDRERHDIAEGLRSLEGEWVPLAYVLNELDVDCDGWDVPKTDVERLANLIEPQPVNGDTSDGYHTFNELYHHRAVLFSVIVAKFSDRAWKSKLHADGTMYDGMFIVGIDTPDGPATYHYDIDPYWSMFRCKELDRAPEWDGHTPSQAIERIGKLAYRQADRQTCYNLMPKSSDDLLCSVCGEHVNVTHAYDGESCHAKFYPNCGAEVVSDVDGR